MCEIDRHYFSDFNRYWHPQSKCQYFALRRSVFPCSQNNSNNTSTTDLLLFNNILSVSHRSPSVLEVAILCADRMCVSVRNVARVLAVLFCILICKLPTTRGHSYLLVPRADWHNENRPHCRRGGPEQNPVDDCRGPCISADSWFYNKTAATTTWRRGQHVLIMWTRNTHQNGFVRLTLVPREHRMSFVAHERGTFQYSCWDIHKRPCDPKRMSCGTDTFLYQTSAIVPYVPDGDYVLGWSWFGGYGVSADGTHRYNFGDYWSCANIRVAGGKSVVSKKNSLPTFVPGNSRGACSATTNKLHQCRVEPCKGLVNVPRLWRPIGFAQPHASAVPTPMAILEPRQTPALGQRQTKMFVTPTVPDTLCRSTAIGKGEESALLESPDVMQNVYTSSSITVEIAEPSLI